MKFLCLGYLDEQKWEAMSKDEQAAAMQECFAYDDVLRKGGHFVAGEALQNARTARTLRWERGRLLVTDGPFIESREYLGGVLVLEARDMQQAVELMSKHPGVRLGGPFEIRPVEELPEVHPRMGRERRDGGATRIFVNLPVRDLKRSIDFFTRLGFAFDPRFTDETAACMIVGDDIHVMLLTEAKFKEFTPKPISDATRSTEVLVALSRESRAAVDDLVRKAVAAGGSTCADARDYGFMYQHGFQDPDGHIWELLYMDAKAAPQA